MCFSKETAGQVKSSYFKHWNGEGVCCNMKGVLGLLLAFFVISILLPLRREMSKWSEIQQIIQFLMLWYRLYCFIKKICFESLFSS